MVNIEKNTQSLEYEMHCLRKAVVELRAASKTFDILAAWGDTVTHFRKASNFALRIGRANDATQRLGSKLEKERSGDPILKYMMFARNVEEHGDNEEFPEPLLGRHTPTLVEIPNFGLFGPGTEVSLSNVKVNGVEVDGHLSWRGTGVPNILGMRTARVVPPQFQLHPVSTKKGSVIPVPRVAAQYEGKVHIHFAEHALSWVEQTIDKLEIDLD